jgi:multicomponent Na+:H+ antiporter subunit G
MILDIVIYIFFGIGVFFVALAGVGLLRFPDVYTRLHAGTKCTTFGSIFLCGSVILYGLVKWLIDGDINSSVLAIHSFFALIAIIITNPTGAHAIARAAHKSGVIPYNAICDDLKKVNTKKIAVKKEERKK